MEASNISIGETVKASAKLQAEDARTMLKDASKLIAMKGAKISEFTLPAQAGDEAVQAMLGPTGNLRAPTIRSGTTLLVGFNEEIFRQHFG